MRRIRCFLLASAALLAAGSPAFAESCRDEAERLSQQHDLQWPAPPMTMESRGVTATDELAPSEGVVEPPAAGDDDMVMEAPETGSDMPTAPEIAPSPTEPPVADLTAEQRTRMEALLAEAVKAEEAGKSDACFERLGEAKKIP